VDGCNEMKMHEGPSKKREREIEIERERERERERAGDEKRLLAASLVLSIKSVTKERDRQNWREKDRVCV
jgi:hypothetical protein